MSLQGSVRQTRSPRFFTATLSFHAWPHALHMYRVSTAAGWSASAAWPLSGQKQELLVINANSPCLPFLRWLADVGIVHPAVACRTQNDEVLRAEAFRRWVLGQVEQVVRLAVAAAAPHHEARVFAKLAGAPARPLDVSRDSIRALIRFQDSLDAL
jgi:hypothetical protein